MAICFVISVPKHPARSVLACAMLSVSWAREKAGERREKRAGTGREKERRHFFSLPAHIFSRAFARFAPLTESLERLGLFVYLFTKMLFTSICFRTQYAAHHHQQVNFFACLS